MNINILRQYLRFVGKIITHGVNGKATKEYLSGNKQTKNSRFMSHTLFKIDSRKIKYLNTSIETKKMHYKFMS